MIKKLAKLINISLEEVITNFRTARCLVVLRVLSENYLSENKDPTKAPISRLTTGVFQRTKKKRVISNRRRRSRLLIKSSYSTVGVEC